MTIAFYMDHNVPSAITNGLRLQGVDVLTAYIDGFDRASDPELLDRATELSRVLFTRDDDLVAEAVARQQLGIHFAGVIYAHQLRVSIGGAIADLLLIARAAGPQDLQNIVQFLPL